MEETKEYFVTYYEPRISDGKDDGRPQKNCHFTNGCHVTKNYQDLPLDICNDEGLCKSPDCTRPMTCVSEHCPETGKSICCVSLGRLTVQERHLFLQKSGLLDHSCYRLSSWEITDLESEYDHEVLLDKYKSLRDSQEPQFQFLRKCEEIAERIIKIRERLGSLPPVRSEVQQDDCAVSESSLPVQSAAKRKRIRRGSPRADWIMMMANKGMGPARIRDEWNKLSQKEKKRIDHENPYKYPSNKRKAAESIRNIIRRRSRD